MLLNQKKIVAFIRSSSKALKSLELLQEEEESLSKAKKLIMSNVTRWNRLKNYIILINFFYFFSTYDMLVRLLLLKESINKWFDMNGSTHSNFYKITEAEWQLSEDLKNLLKPFSEVVDNFQKSNSVFFFLKRNSNNAHLFFLLKDYNQ